MGTKSHLLWRVNISVGSGSRRRQLQTLSSSIGDITIICGGKGIAHQSEALGKWPRQRAEARCLSSGLAGVTSLPLCVCVCVYFVINHCRFEEIEGRHSLYPSMLFILLVCLHGRWPSHPIWPSLWGQGQAPCSPSPPGPHCSPVVLETRLSLPPPFCCVNLWRRSAETKAADKTAEHWLIQPLISSRFPEKIKASDSKLIFKGYCYLQL